MVEDNLSSDLEIPLAGQVSHSPIRKQEQVGSRQARELERRLGCKPPAPASNRATLEASAPARGCKVTCRAWKAESLPREVVRVELQWAAGKRDPIIFMVVPR